MARIDIASKEELEAWLKDKPTGWEAVLMARIALRALPIWSGLLTKEYEVSITDSDAIISTFFRYSALSYIKAILVAKGDIINEKKLENLINQKNERINLNFEKLNIIYKGSLWPLAVFFNQSHKIDIIFSYASIMPIWNYISQDINYGDVNFGNIIKKPLWISNDNISEIQASQIDRWTTIKEQLLERSQHWALWTNWYDAVLAGQPPWGLPVDRGTEITLEMLSWPESEWEQGPAHINGRIAELVMKARAELAAPKSDLVVPSQSPAAIEPIWDGDRLVLPRTSARVDLDDASLAAALVSLRNSITALADDADQESNIDKRAVRKLRRLAELIPDAAPSQANLFALGHAQESLREFQATVSEQWPEILASDYAALMLHYDRTVRQFPRWRDFVRNAAKGHLSAEDIAATAIAAANIAQALRDEGPAEIVDAAIPRTIDRLLAMLPNAQDAVAADDAVTGGAEEIALDLLDGIDNVLKRLAEKYLEGQKLAGTSAAASKNAIIAVWNSKTLSETRLNYSREFQRELPRVGAKIGKAHARALPYAAYGGLIFVITFVFSPYAGGAAAAAPLLNKFKWVRDLLKRINPD